MISFHNILLNYHDTYHGVFLPPHTLDDYIASANPFMFNQHAV